MFCFSQVIAAEGEQKASRALKEASEVIAESSSALQLRYLQVILELHLGRQRVTVTGWEGQNIINSTHKRVDSRKFHKFRSIEERSTGKKADCRNNAKMQRETVKRSKSKTTFKLSSQNLPHST